MSFIGLKFVSNEDVIFEVRDISDHDEALGPIYICEREDGYVFYLNENSLRRLHYNGEIDFYDEH